MTIKVHDTLIYEGQKLVSWKYLALLIMSDTKLA